MSRLIAVLTLSVLGLIWLVGAGESQVKTKTVKGQVPDGWSKALSLSEEQATKIRSVDASFRTKIQALQEQIDALKTQSRQEMVKLLSDEQKTKLRQLAIGEESPPDKKKVDPKNKGQ